MPFSFGAARTDRVACRVYVSPSSKIDCEGPVGVAGRYATRPTSPAWNILERSRTRALCLRTCASRMFHARPYLEWAGRRKHTHVHVSRLYKKYDLHVSYETVCFIFLTLPVRASANVSSSCARAALDTCDRDRRAASRARHVDSASSMSSS